jgi:hypothetical protein
MVTQPWRLAAFDVAIRTPSHPLFPPLSSGSFHPLRGAGAPVHASHCTARILPFTPGPPILHRLLHNLPCLCLCRPITPSNPRSFRRRILDSTRFGPPKPPIPPWHIRLHLPHHALAQPVIYASTTLQRQVARPVYRLVPPRECDCARWSPLAFTSAFHQPEETLVAGFGESNILYYSQVCDQLSMLHRLGRISSSRHKCPMV